MPFYLKERDVLAQVAGLRSVLIVPCRFCPAASLAVRERKPYLQPLLRGLNTGAYQSFLDALTRRLRDEGIETQVFDSRLPHHFVACMWSSGRRRALARRAARFDAVIVLGCEAAAETVRNSLGDVRCRVIQGMEVDGGIMNVVPTVRFPFDITLRVRSVTPYEPVDRPRAVAGCAG